MNIKSFMALAVVALTAACASQEPQQAVEEAADANVAVTEEAAVATAVTDAIDAAPANGKNPR
jgi:hypothetical protein